MVSAGVTKAVLTVGGTVGSGHGRPGNAARRRSLRGCVRGRPPLTAHLSLQRLPRGTKKATSVRGHHAACACYFFRGGGGLDNKGGIGLRTSLRYMELEP